MIFYKITPFPFQFSQIQIYSTWTNAVIVITFVNQHILFSYWMNCNSSINALQGVKGKSFYEKCIGGGVQENTILLLWREY